MAVQPIKEQFPLSLGPQEGKVGGVCLATLSPLLQRQPAASMQVSVAPHTQTLLWTAMPDPSRVPAFHLAAPLLVCQWSRWSPWLGAWEPG